jgi:type IV secretory pathway TrbF-like protein
MQNKIQEYRDIYKACKKEYNVIIKTAKVNYIQNIITISNNTLKVLWKFVNRDRGSPNNTLTFNIHLQEGNVIAQV